MIVQTPPQLLLHIAASHERTIPWFGFLKPHTCELCTFNRNKDAKSITEEVNTTYRIHPTPSPTSPPSSPSSPRPSASPTPPYSTQPVKSKSYSCLPAKWAAKQPTGCSSATSRKSDRAPCTERAMGCPPPMRSLLPFSVSTCLYFCCCAMSRIRRIRIRRWVSARGWAWLCWRWAVRRRSRRVVFIWGIIPVSRCGLVFSRVRRWRLHGLS
jgi:hypothetical protein